MNYELQRRIFSLAYFVIPLAMLFTDFYTWPWLVASLVFYYLVVFIGVECGLHRYFTHNSYRTSRFWEYVLSLFPIMLTTGSPIAWCAIHRAHHQRSDTEQDPHSPRYVSLWRLFTVTWRVDHLNLKVGFPRGVDFGFQRFIHEHYYKLVSVYIIMLAVIDPALVVYFWAIPSLLTHIYQQVVNTLGHSDVYHDDTQDYSRDVGYLRWLFPILAHHHKHHLHPREHRLGRGLRYGEPDFPAWLIERIFRRG